MVARLPHGREGARVDDPEATTGPADLGLDRDEATDRVGVKGALVGQIGGGAVRVGEADSPLALVRRWAIRLRLPKRVADSVAAQGWTAVAAPPSTGIR